MQPNSIYRFPHRCFRLPGGSLAGGAARDGEEAEVSLRVAAGDAARRRLVGPGSSPPTCRARCGRCSPCRPVHVAVHPGRIIPLDYYPEAWRCKCGSKLFMP
ncbi:unnamed protein product [Spirodela intermedia]|uniref:Epidermal patterning factor-like protein n=1 Tax=Spirodela intermedia TaxID=51605 RepID=A0A7I8KAG4_SPIIN|nr:unnamed protein product [Spirodela intermedia]